MDLTPKIQNIYNVKGNACTVVALGAASVESAALDYNAVLLVADQDCHIAFGAGADSNALFLPASTPTAFEITPGTTISAIRNSASGKLFIQGLN